MNKKELAKRLKAEQEALQNSETTPIHNIGYIQPNRYLLSVLKLANLDKTNT